MDNKQIVQTIYAAFGRGDIPAILEQLDDNVDWEYGYRNAPDPVPRCRQRPRLAISLPDRA